ncbi:MAG: M48 family metalloprotease [Armatimonadia bacterium]
MARKTKTKKTKVQKAVGLRVCDFAFPGEKGSYWTGIIGVIILFGWLAAGAFLMLNKPETAAQKFYIPLYIVVYPIAAVLIGNWLAAKPRATLMKKAGRQSKVMNNNFADLYRVLARQASLLGMKTPPDMYLVSDPQPLMYSLAGGRGSIIASQALRDAMAPEEFEALMAHEVTHHACKHVRLDLAETFIRSSGLGVKIGLFPVLLIGFFGRAWADLIEFTADRGALLVMLRPSILNAAIVKFAVVADPNAGITREELQAYIDSAGDISTDAKQIERHFKVGQFMSSQPGLRERIEQLTEFPRTEAGQQALAKMAEIQGVSIANIPQRKAAEDDMEQMAVEETDQLTM